MRLLVTGGAGFIGSHFIRSLSAGKYPGCTKVTVVDSLTYAGSTETAREIAGYGFEFIKSDINDFETMYEVTKSIDTIVHFAAESHVDRSISDPFRFTQTNVLGTHTLLEVARINSISKFLQVSTDEVYGSIPFGSADERSPLNPSSPYSASKTGADLLVNAYHHTYSIPTLITRSSNNFGPYQHPEKLIPKLITNLILGKKLPIYGDGLNVRDWIYVDDNVEAIIEVLISGEIGEIYNIGGRNEWTNLQVAKHLLKLFDKDESEIEYVEDRAGHDFRYSIGSNKNLETLKGKKNSHIEEQLSQTVAWYLENQSWWRGLIID